ncbi:MAG: hypothetical protein Q9159_000902 [Coniocarpon cinnabarinum]
MGELSNPDLEKHIREDDSTDSHRVLDHDVASCANDDKNLPVSPSSPSLKSKLPTWDGPDDPANPRNWPMWERVFGVFVPSWYSFVV